MNDIERDSLHHWQLPTFSNKDISIKRPLCICKIFNGFGHLRRLMRNHRMWQILEIGKRLQYADKSRRFGDFDYSWDSTVREDDISGTTGSWCVEMYGFGVLERFQT